MLLIVEQARDVKSKIIFIFVVLTFHQVSLFVKIYDNKKNLKCGINISIKISKSLLRESEIEIINLKKA